MRRRFSDPATNSGCTEKLLGNGALTCPNHGQCDVHEGLQTVSVALVIKLINDT